MNIKTPFLWYRHIMRGVYYATAINMRSRRTGKPDTVTALMYTGILCCGGHLIIAYYVALFNLPIENFHTFHTWLNSFVFFNTHKGVVNLLLVLTVLFGVLLAWFCCCYKVTFEEISAEFNHVKPSHWFVSIATFTVPVLGFIAMMYAVSQERKRLGVNEFPPQQEVIASTAIKAVPDHLERKTSGT